MSREKIREYIAKAFIVSGVAIFVGSTGACENGSYSLPEYIFCIAFGAVLGLVGVEIRKEVRDGA